MATRESYRWPSKSPGDGGRLRLSRRVLLASAFPCFLSAQKAEVSSFDLSLLDEWTVPNELFFVHDHFAAPQVSSAGWKLSVGGAVATPQEISYEDLTGRPNRILPVTLECAENPPGGGLVSHAEWTGLSLAALLEKAQIGSNASHVRLSGADGFSRSIPLAKAMHPDTLVVYRMNGEKLPPSHGFPARAVVPGWYGMDSVKWLSRIEVLDHEDTSIPAEFRYRRRVRSLLLGVRETDAVTAMNVNSAFSRPVDGAVLVGRKFVIRGAAWAGSARVRKVEVSTDGGKTWTAAKLTPVGAAQPQPYAWVYWEYAWSIPGAGSYELLARATDDSGRVQPAERAPDRADGYEVNTWQSVHVTVL